MEKALRHFFFLIFAFSLVFLLTGREVSARAPTQRHGISNGARYKKLFVFGDSYADTGNLGNLGSMLTSSWYEPYGMTFPHKPTGRFSNGRLLTDYVASSLGIKSPLPYKFRRLQGVSKRLLPYGMNFAHAGSGIFDNGNFQDNLTLQVDAFQWQVKRGVFPEYDLKSSVALVSVSGNDYKSYKETNGSDGDVLDFVKRLFQQLKIELKRIHEVGVPKVLVANLHPVGCTPYMTRATNYTKCDSTARWEAQAHNRKLENLIKELNGAGTRTFFSLDLFTAFDSIINQVKGAPKFESILKPCCEGNDSMSNCAQTDENGVKKYSLCSNPDSHFYWDWLHPSQAGWAAAVEYLKPATRRFLSL